MVRSSCGRFIVCRRRCGQEDCNDVFEAMDDPIGTQPAVTMNMSPATSVTDPGFDGDAQIVLTVRGDSSQARLMKAIFV